MIETAWAAGFFEGEGTVWFSTRPSRRTLTVEISQVDRIPLDLIADRWGGRVYDYAGSNGQRPYSRWAAVARVAAAFLADIQPHLVRPIVQERVRVALDFQAARRADWSNRSAEYHARDAAWGEEMRRLNERGLTELEQLVLARRTQP